MQSRIRGVRERMAFSPEQHRKFRREKRWNTASILMGITMRPWLSILWTRFSDIAWVMYGHRVVALTMSAAFNSCVSCVEEIVYGRAVRQVELRDDPVFVLGHPRTGTTLIFNLLGVDTQSFIFPTTFAVTFPSTCLTLRPIKRLAAAGLPKTRPMDNMELGLDMPQEDEMATTQLTGGVSTYMPIVFMTRWRDYLPFFTFKEAEEASFHTWREGFHTFLRKVVVYWGGYRGRRMLIKSPPHTARVPVMTELFPRSSFIYIYRHPYDVFLSAANMAEKTYSLTYLDDPKDTDIQEFILSQFELLLDEYLAARGSLPNDRLLELRYEDFEKDPLKGMEQIYAHFGWPMPMREELRTHCERLGGYKKNSFNSLPEPLRQLIYTRWRRAFDVFGYEP